MYKLVAFDLDGTLADTLADLAAAVNVALKKRGLRTYPVDDYRYFVGNGVDNLIRAALADHFTPALADEVKADFQAYYTEHCQDLTCAYSGMDGLLKRLDADGIQTAVISNKPDRFVPGILAALYPGHRFTFAWGQQEGVARKPDPDALNRLIALCGFEKDAVLYVGDSDVDVMFAHSAGVKVCGVSWGFRGAEELTAAGADFLAGTAEQLYDRIRGGYEQT